MSLFLPLLIPYPNSNQLHSKTGGAIVRTDLCNRTLATAKPGTNLLPHCLILEGGNSITNNAATAGIGGGLLVTIANLAFTRCGGKLLVDLRACLLKGNPAAPGLPTGNTALDRDTDNIGSVVARMMVMCVVLPSAAGRRCDSRGINMVMPLVSIPPGATLQTEVGIQDWQGSIITSGFDSTMALQVRPG